MVATAGEALIDLVQRCDGTFVPCEGGAVYNFTRALALQGMGTIYLNPLSHDSLGRMLEKGLGSAGVQLAQPLPIGLPTSLALVGLDAGGKPEYSFYRDGVADRAVDAHRLLALTHSQPQLRAVYTGCLALVPQDSATYLPWLQGCRARGLMVVVDANLRPDVGGQAPAYRDSVHAALAQADVVKVSDDDLALLFADGRDPMVAARGLFQLGPAQLVALTRGEAGASLLARDGRAWHARETAALDLVDTVGAGDCFLAGVVREALHDCGADGGAALASVSDKRARRILARGIGSASCCVQKRGCRPPDRAEVERWLARQSIVFSG